MNAKKLLWLLLWLAARPVWALTPSGFMPAEPVEKKSLETLRTADSLFVRGQFGLATTGYKALVWQQRRASPQILLRLAYAQQQQGRYAAALLALSMAQAREPRLSTWRQLVALATRLRLVGYPNTWQQELRVRLHRYYYPGLQALLAGAVLGVVGLLLRGRRTGRLAWLAYGVYLAGVGGYLHWLGPRPAGLVARPGVALMAGPGAGAAWLSTAAVGDRLPVLGRQDIWYRVQWQQREAFVRAADVLVVE